MTNLKQLDILVKVIETGSFTAAAEQLFMTQPAISWQIKKLEEEMDVNLFKKRDRSLILSEAGEIIYRTAKEILSIYDHAMNAIGDYKLLSTGKLAIGAGTVPGEFILPHLLPKFLDKHPGIDLQLTVDDSQTIIEQLTAAKIDIAIVGSKSNTPGVCYEPWLEDEIICVTSAQNTTIPENCGLHNLLKYTMVGRGGKSGTWATISKALAETDISIDSFASYIPVSTTHGMIATVAAGLGFAFCSRYAAQHGLENGGLKEIKISNFNIKRNFYIARWETPYPIPPVESFVELLREYENRDKVTE